MCLVSRSSEIDLRDFLVCLTGCPHLEQLLDSEKFLSQRIRFEILSQGQTGGLPLQGLPRLNSVVIYELCIVRWVPAFGIYVGKEREVGGVT